MAPSGNVGTTMSDSSTSVMNVGTLKLINGSISRPASGTCSAMALRSSTSGSGSSWGKMGWSSLMGSRSRRGFLIVIGGPIGTPGGTSGTREIVGDLGVDGDEVPACPSGDDVPAS